MVKILFCRTHRFGLVSSRLVFKVPEAPSDDQKTNEKKPEPVLEKGEKSVTGIPVALDESSDASPKNVYEMFTSHEIVPAKKVDVSVPYFLSVDEYPRGPHGEILHPVTKKPMTDSEIALHRAGDARMPAIYRTKYEKPPEKMPDKLEIPEGKQMFVFGGSHHGKGVVDRLSAQYPGSEIGFFQCQTLDDMNAQAEKMGKDYPKEKLQGSTATIMVDPDLFFGSESYDQLQSSMDRLCKTLKGFGMKVAVATSPPIGDYRYEQGGPTDKKEQEADYTSTKVPREKWSNLNEWTRRTFLRGGLIDRVLPLDVPFEFYRDTLKLHPDYRSSSAYLSGEGLDVATKVFASGVNGLNAPKDTSDATVETPAVTPVERLEIREDQWPFVLQLAQDVAALRFMDTFDQKVFDRSQAVLMHASEYGIDQKVVSAIVADPEMARSKLYLRHAEYRVQQLRDAKEKGENPVSQVKINSAIIAIEDAEKVGADKEKIAALKKEVKQSTSA